MATTPNPAAKTHDDPIAPLFTLYAAKFRIDFTAVRKPRRIYGMEAAIRGRLGFNLKRVCCPFPGFRNRPCEGCALSDNCLYLTLFAPEPAPLPPALAALNLPPLQTKYPARPFVLAVETGDGEKVLAEDGRGWADFTLLGPAIRYCSLFLEAAAGAIRSLSLEMADLRILSPASENPRQKDQTADAVAWPLSVWIEGESRAAFFSAEHPDRLTLQCLTPVKLIQNGRAAEGEIPFDLFVKSAVRRLRDLKRAYGGDNDMGDPAPGFFHGAGAVAIQENRLFWSRRKRRSVRQGQDVYLNGFKGEIVYGGDLQPYRRLARAAAVVHIGKGTSAGNGRIRII